MLKKFNLCSFCYLAYKKVTNFQRCTLKELKLSYVIEKRLKLFKLIWHRFE
jgi:hypothetical protein